MSTSAIAVGVLVFSFAVPARPARELASAAVQASARDETLAKAAAERRGALDKMLSAEVRKQLTGAMLDVLGRLASAEQPPDALPLARKAVGAQFSGASPTQSDLLTFYVLADLARITTDEDTLNKRAAPATKTAGTKDLSQAEVTRLLHLMDRGSRYATALSEALQKIASTPDSAVKNLK